MTAPTHQQTALPVTQARFLICDVETTGSDATKHHIFDLALVELHQDQITPVFSQLFNPRQHIPRPISSVTGIFDYHVFSAPLLQEHIATIYHHLNQPNTIFVAHNVQFDWKFLVAAFQQAGYSMPSLPRLCTYRLARRLLPRNKKFNVQSLAQYFGIRIEQFHRALADATATAHILQHLITLARNHYAIETIDELLRLQYKSVFTLRAHRRKRDQLASQLRQLPSTPGVYEFYDQNDQLLYVGKAKNLSQRIHQYFQQPRLPRKIAEMLHHLHSIRWTETQTELAALLLEAQKIKTQQPPYNTVAKRYKRYTYLKLHIEDTFPYLECVQTLANDGAHYYGPFRSRRAAEQLKTLLESFFPLRRCSSTALPNRPCLDFYLHHCLAPCTRPVDTQYRSTITQLQQLLDGDLTELLTFFHRRIEQHSQNQEYEHAQQLRDQLHEIQRVLQAVRGKSAALQNRHLVVLKPSESYPHKVELYFIRYGTLHYQRLIGKRIPLKELQHQLQHTYDQLPPFPPSYSNLQLLSDHIRIVSHWLYLLRPPAIIHHRNDFASLEQLLNQIQHDIYRLLLSATSPSR